MGERTKIEWTDKTFNPWWGCTKVGPGCDHCYAEAFDRRVGGDHWGAGKPRRLIKDWTGPRKWDREAAATGKRLWVFCASMADVFDNEVPDEWRARLWDLVRECRNLNWQFVTKRIGNAAKMLPADWAENFGHCGLLITVVNQQEADRDVPKLMATPAAWRGLSMEPLLGPVDLRNIPHPWRSKDADWVRLDALARNGIGPVGIHWVIVGGESGHHARSMHPDWARSIRDQCATAGVPYFFKQWGEWAPSTPEAAYGNPRSGWAPIRSRIGRAVKREELYPEAGAAFVERLGKARAGRVLDGRTHDAMPDLPTAPRGE